MRVDVGDKMNGTGAAVSLGSLALSWLDQHHFAVSVTVAVVVGFVTVCNTIFNMWIKYDEYKKRNPCD